MEKEYKAYCGVKPCGCTTAIMVDDELTTADDVANFARSMAKTGRRLIHLTYNPDKTPCPMTECKCESVEGKNK